MLIAAAMSSILCRIVVLPMRVEMAAVEVDEAFENAERRSSMEVALEMEELRAVALLLPALACCDVAALVGLAFRDDDAACAAAAAASSSPGVPRSLHACTSNNPNDLQCGLGCVYSNRSRCKFIGWNLELN